MNNKETLCKACRARIMFLKTRNGKTAPVDADAVEFVPDVNGRALYVLPDGTTAHGVAPKPGDPDVHIGYISHFATCTNPDFFRKRNKSRRKEAAG